MKDLDAPQRSTGSDALPTTSYSDRNSPNIFQAHGTTYNNFDAKIPPMFEISTGSHLPSRIAQTRDDEIGPRSPIDHGPMESRGLGARRRSYADIFQPQQGGHDHHEPFPMPRPSSYHTIDETNNLRKLPSNSCDSPSNIDRKSKRTVPPGFSGISSPRGSPLSTSSGRIPQKTTNRKLDKVSAIKSSFINCRSSSMTSLDKIAEALSDLGLSEATIDDLNNYVKTHQESFHSPPGIHQMNYQSYPQQQILYAARKSLSSANLRSFANQHALGESSSSFNTRPSLLNCNSRETTEVGKLCRKGSMDIDPLLERIVPHNVASSYVQRIRKQVGNSREELELVRKAYIQLLLARQRELQELRTHGSHPHEIDMRYLENTLRSLESVNIASAPNEPWPYSSGKRKHSSLLAEFKANKNKAFKLSDIVNHVVEFSKDQLGSRFIQQKLEVGSIAEKEKIFPEIICYAHSLMTDVFGNYVIQKFFEHGTKNQREELTARLTGHVLPLSLQMYGCRVIQKVLEVAEVKEKVKIAEELDGWVMKCVKDQNGNHVVQKCIECIPEDKLHFIVSTFYGQAVSLSCHPYGCRVIQRVLERCEDHHARNVIMGEIMHSICTLSQDQYGNYVIQHILEHGKASEISEIVKKLAADILKMSQQKFASNVIEKCLIHGGKQDREHLVKQMLGSTNENAPLQVMMKDPFGNYVVQKVLETCGDESLGIIVSRIKVHLKELKKLTYGKHIVTRVERLIATGESRIGTKTRRGDIQTT